MINLGSPVMLLCSISALMPSSCGMVVYRLFTSNDISYTLSDGGMIVVLRSWMRLAEFL